MKLSFSLSSKPSSRTNPSRSLAAADGDDKGREFVTVFDPSQTLAANAPLPEDRGLDEFKDVPVEGFGAAILAGYGWSEGKGIGRNNSKGDIKVVQYDRRWAGTAGLGYNPSTADPKKKRGEWVFKDDNKVKDKNRDSDKVIRVSKVKKREKDVSLVHRSSSSNREKREKKEGSVRWLTSHIKVRVISKEFMRGKLYLKKGRIIDVVGPMTCDISMDESRELVQGLDQDMLETVVPKRGGSVLVLYGKHKGVYGSLVERNLEDETGVVRDADSHDMFNVRFEQIAEYVGDPAYLGY